VITVSTSAPLVVSLAFNHEISTSSCPRDDVPDFTLECSKSHAINLIASQEKKSHLITFPHQTLTTEQNEFMPPIPRPGPCASQDPSSAKQWYQLGPGSGNSPTARRSTNPFSSGRSQAPHQSGAKPSPTLISRKWCSSRAV
jgi:hypothetical protein